MCEIFDLSDSDLSLRPVLQGNRLQCCVQGGVGMRVGPSSTWVLVSLFLSPLPALRPQNLWVRG